MLTGRVIQPLIQVIKDTIQVTPRATLSLTAWPHSKYTSYTCTYKLENKNSVQHKKPLYEYHVSIEYFK